MTTKSPRTRDTLNRSLPHNAGYAGGKILRKRMKALAVRKAGCEEIRETLRKRSKSVPESAFRMPGSMR